MRTDSPALSKSVAATNSELEAALELEAGPRAAAQGVHAFGTSGSGCGETPLSLWLEAAASSTFGLFHDKHIYIFDF